MAIPTHHACQYRFNNELQYTDAGVQHQYIMAVSEEMPPIFDDQNDEVPVFKRSPFHESNGSPGPPTLIEEHCEVVFDEPEMKLKAPRTKKFSQRKEVPKNRLPDVKPVDYLRLGGLAGPKKADQMDMTSFMAKKSSMRSEKEIKNLSDKYERQKRTQAMDTLRNVAYALHNLVTIRPDLHQLMVDHGITGPVEDYYQRMYHRDIYEGLRDDFGNLSQH